MLWSMTPARAATEAAGLVTVIVVDIVAGVQALRLATTRYNAMVLIDDKAECDGTCIPFTWHEGSFMAFVKAVQDCFSSSAADNRLFRPPAYPQEAFPPWGCGETSGETRGEHFPPTRSSDKYLRCSP